MFDGGRKLLDKNYEKRFFRFLTNLNGMFLYCLNRLNLECLVDYIKLLVFGITL